MSRGRSASSPEVRRSKFLSRILRHDPGGGGILLDAEGWADADAVIAAVAARFGSFGRAELDRLVAENDKQRFAFSADGARIRASQGHSVAVDLALEPQTPPPTLYHGTKAAFLPSILDQGLLPGRRRHVHLSADVATARKVADRRAGATAILEIRTAALADHPFYLSANDVWLTDHVPPEHLRILAD